MGALTLAALGCAPDPAAAPTALLPGPDAPEPVILVALTLDADTVELGGSDAVRIEDGDGVPLGIVPSGSSATASLIRGGVAIRIGGIALGPADRLVVTPAGSGEPVRVAGRRYRGTVSLEPRDGRLLAVNRVGIEDYLGGVINAEMGRRGPGEREALIGQAIVSRTFALRMLGRSRTRGYDVVATVSDQAYGGVDAELDQGLEAVAASRGVVLVHGGQPIEAFFHSTCAGRTAAGEEAFVNGALPWLRSVSDLAPDGTAWCAISPRYRWREEWTAAALSTVLRSTLPSLGVARDRVTGARSVEVTGRTGSGRVAAIAVGLMDGGTVPVEGQAIRRVLQPSGGGLLRSNGFTLVSDRQGGRLIRLVAEGGGAGHGVGFCQWGAVGRARAGQSAERILTDYFAGVDLERRWP